MYISNHSYGVVSGWITGDYSGNYGPHWFGVWGNREDEGFGQYDSEAAEWDSICYAAPYYLPFKSAGNDRGDYAPSNGTTFYYIDGGTWQSKSYNSSTDPYSDGWDNGGFDTIPYNGTAKNIMTVGAVSDAIQNGMRYLPSAIMTGFSSWGPTDDGRIKPDIVANGTDLYSSIDSSNTSYASYSGTSMSAPNASGSAALLEQLYCRLFPGQAMRASTLKALIIHTADDLGNPGPDYSFGWGLMNTKAAADQIIDRYSDSSANKIVEGLLSAANPTDSYTFIWNGDTAIRATLCWTDPPADALTGLDNPSPRLINDLDLRIIGPNGSIVYYPYILDRLNPANSATTGDNTRDNVEQVYISSPYLPGIYTVEVNYKGTLTNSQQHYSLITSGQHHNPSSRGTIKLDKETYSCTDSVKIELRDGDLAGNGSCDVLVSTSGSDTETATLYEDGFRGGIFTGTIATSSDPGGTGDNILQVANGQTITAVYQDANDGNGSSAEASLTATVDCQAPIIVNIEISDITSSAAIISFETNEPTTAAVSYGLQCQELNTLLEDPVFSTEHTFRLAYLAPQTDYYFVITASDQVGNVTINDNGGLCYQFTTIGEPRGIHVPADYNTIQAAINAAVDGNIIIVADGTYTGGGNRDIDFLGKAIIVTSENGPANCIINCQGSFSTPHRGFYFHSGEANDSIVSGFTIINGFGPQETMGSGSYSAGGAIMCKQSSPTIEDCIFQNNEADDSDYWGRGGAINCYNSHAVISNCTFENNRACYGGGLYAEKDSLTITDCTFTGNTATWGGAVETSETAVLIDGCIISNNRSFGYGGGLYCYAGGVNITNCLVKNNTAYDPGMGSGIGGGIRLEANPGQVFTVTNCTVVNNFGEAGAGGINWGATGSVNVINCIVRGNSSPQIHGTAGTVTYSNIEGGFTGQNNIDADPCFVSATDYHLAAGSPCIDAGTDNALTGFPPRDIEGRPRPLDGDANQTAITDMGAYEYWNQPSGPFIALDANHINLFAFENGTASKVLSIRNGWIGTLNWQISETCSWLEVSPIYGDSAGEINEITIVADATGLSNGYYRCDLIISDPNATNSPLVVPIQLRVGPLLVPQEFPTIQAAIDSAQEADVIIVADGTYAGIGNQAINFKGKAITVMSENGPYKCTIDCQDSGRAFNFNMSESNNSILNGFTIIGGGISCVGSSPSIMNCRIIGCYSNNGGGIYFLNSTGKVVNTIIMGCSSGNKGGGIYSDGGYPKILNCTIVGNSASLGSGYYCRSAGSVKNSIFWGNGIDAPYSNNLPTVSYSNIQGGFSGVGNI